MHSIAANSISHTWRAAKRLQSPEGTHPGLHMPAVHPAVSKVNQGTLHCTIPLQQFHSTSPISQLIVTASSSWQKPPVSAPLSAYSFGGSSAHQDSLRFSCPPLKLGTVLLRLAAQGTSPNPRCVSHFKPDHCWQKSRCQSSRYSVCDMMTFCD